MAASRLKAPSSRFLQRRLSEGDLRMHEFEQKNIYFDRLFNTPDLKWLGQNTNHIPVHQAVRAAMIAAIDAEEFHAYAPPAGFESLRQGIVEDLGLTDQAALVTDGAVMGLFLVCQSV